jgi:CRP/FNR family transcriptional regulator, cyclic AMP receptor protein
MFSSRGKVVKNIKSFLQKFTVFSGLNEEELQLVETITNTRPYKKRMNVFMEGEVREAVFFILSGIVKAYKIDEEGNEQVISILHEGDMFPHVGFFDESSYPATVEVVDDAELLVIRIDDFEDLMMKHPQISIKVMKMLGQKILDLQERIQGFISKDVQHRFIHTLLKLAEEQGMEQENGIYLNISITNQDFANMVGTSRESISRALTKMKKQGLLKADRQGILIYDIKKLAKL